MKKPKSFLAQWFFYLWSEIVTFQKYFHLNALFPPCSKPENSDQARNAKNVWILLKVETIFVHISNSVGVNVFAASRPGRMTFLELVKSNQIKIDSDFLKMKLLKKEAHGLKHCKKTECALTNILKNEILNLEWQYLYLCPSLFLHSLHFYLILIRALSAPKLTFSHPDHSQDRGDRIFFQLADANSGSSYRETSRTVLSPNPWPACPSLTHYWHWT